MNRLTIKKILQLKVNKVVSYQKNTIKISKLPQYNVAIVFMKMRL